MQNAKYILALIFGFVIVAFLILLPRIPIKPQNKYVNLDTSVGGYRLNLLGKVLDFSQLKKGLDLQGGVRVVLKADMSKISDSEKDSALESAKTVIGRRVDLLGVSEPVVQTSKVGGDYRIVVELPGINDVTSAVNLIGQTAQLTFKQLKPEITYDQSKFSEYYTDKKVWDSTGITGADLKGADVVFGQDTVSRGSPQIRLKFSNEGRNKFSEVAKKNINRPIAIYLDENDLPISMPTVNPDLAKGLTEDPVITGTFTTDEANNLSIALRAGALPVPVEVIQQTVIGATLGDESVKRSLVAGITGVMMVMVFMLLNYGRLGLIADVALIFYIIFTLAVFKILGVVMTLPGIAGFILSIGMAVDANILIFERIKEELSWGRPFNLALKYGFERAWPSIKDSNVASLLTSAILFQLGTGLVRGFALTLAIGVVISMISAIYATRNLIEVFYLNKK